MSYGSINNQDAFQVKIDQILEVLKGVVSIADDIVVHGATEEQHDNNMRNKWRKLVRMVLDVCMTRMALDQTLSS